MHWIGKLRFSDPCALLCSLWIVLASTLPAQPQVLMSVPFGAVAFSSDGALAVFSRANALVLLDVATWKVRWNAKVESGSVAALAFSQDGNRLAIATSDFLTRSLLGQPQDYVIRIHILETRTGSTERELADTRATMIKDLSFTSDGSLLAVVMRGNNEILLWDVSKDRMAPLSATRPLGNWAAAFSPTGDMLAWVTITPESPPGFEIRLFDTANRLGVARVARGTMRPLTSVPLAFSPDGKILAFATQTWDLTQPTTEIELFDVASRKSVRKITTREIGISHLVFSEDSQSILGSGVDVSWVGRGGSGVRPSARDNRICRWDVRTGKLQGKVDGEFNMGLGWLRNFTNKFVRVPGRNLYVFVDAIYSFSFYDAATLQPTDAIAVPLLFDAKTPSPSQIPQDFRDAQHALSVHRILAISFDAKGRILAASSDGNAYSWTGPQERRPNKIRLDPDIGAVAFSPDTRVIAITGGSQAGVSIVDAVSGSTVQSLTASSAPAGALAFSPDGTWFAAGRADGTIHMWNTKSWQAKPLLTGPKGAITAIAFSRDSSLLASGGDDHIIRIWEVTSGALVRSLSGHGDKISTLVFGARNDMLASASAADSRVMIWNVNSAANPKRLRGFWASMRSLAFSSDGSILAGAGDEDICLWSSATGKLVRELAVKIRTPRASIPPRSVARFTDAMMVLTFSPDGRLMACGGMNNTILLWEVATWKYIILSRGVSQ